MKAVLQRVKSASVTVDGQQISSIGRGLLVLAGVGKEDTEKDMDTMVGRILRAKLWPADEDGGQWKKNVQDIEGEVLCVSQFTLYGDMKKAKPNFNGAADVETARRLYDYFFQKMRAAYKPERVQNGVFQAMMDVDLRNDGPVTIEISTKLPPSEKKEKKKESDESAEGEKKSYEFKLPASLLE
ncbi:D-aminoacyl-tRNA deacylase [Aspergillus melleus]|uniref:D-aminoacyl-tRNA deacylase n=1 Tax=Aspergillus melleus TaxID=138277 RepID=UPI001E8D0D99|nr:D-tyrosyl-tRNA(Tyr) deacylase [Aspergillus melleus]KAH8423366.1 D-tyrosyl-tRNA(Tyr) deacylase [Aspergillus melleus]